MNISKSLFLFLMGVVCVNLHAVDVPLYVQPNKDAPTLEAVKDEQTLFTKAQPVGNEALREAGWMWVESPAVLKAYVHRSFLEKDHSFRYGAPVRLSPGNKTGIFTTIAPSDKTSILKEGEWIEIQLTKTIPLYFQKTQLPDIRQPLPLAEGEPQTQSTRQQSSLQTPPHNERVAQRDSSQPQTKPSERPVYTHATVPTHEKPVAVPRYYRGVLREARSFFGRAPYPLELRSPNGKRIAYIDTSSLLASGSLSSLLGKSVIVQGVGDVKKNKGTLVIHARTLRAQ